MPPEHPLQLRLANGLEVLAALWLITSPFGLGYYLLNPPLWNSVVVGTLVAFFAILRIMLPSRYGGLSWINAILGVWLIISPFLFGFAWIEAALWNSVIVGLLVILLALWSHSVAKRATNAGLGG